VAPANPRDKTFKQLADILHQHFNPKPLIIAEHFHFHKCDQGPGETIGEFLAELRCLATHCDFGDYLDQALRDCLVCHQCTQ